MGGVAHAKKDKGRGVAGVGDLFLVEEDEVFGDLAGAGGDGDGAEDLCGEAAAERWGFGADREGGSDGRLLPFGRNGGTSPTPLRFRSGLRFFKKWGKRGVVNSGGFAGDAV